MCEAFARLGLQVTLYYIPSSTFKDDIMRYYDVKIPFVLKPLPRAVVPLRKSFSLEKWTALPSFAHAFVWSGFVTALACREKADFYFVREPMIAWWLGRRGLPTVLEIHDISRGVERQFVHWASRQSSIKLIVAVTESLRADFVKQFNIPSEKTLTLPNGVELERFSCSITKESARQQLGLAQDGALVVYTGKVSPEKGVDTLVKAAAWLQDVQIVIVGGTASTNEQLRLLVDEIGIGNVKLVEFVPPSEIALYLKAADVLVSPQSAKYAHSTYTSPLKLFEYMASGRPIVASRLPILQEILADGQNALLYAADDAVALAEAIKRLFTEEQLGRKLSEQALQDVQRYTRMHRAERILQFMGFSDHESVEKLADF
jgi:glycosyltransferase involved in cell wall biosynthesis